MDIVRICLRLYLQVTSTGWMSTVAGNGLSGNSGDGGPATAAAFGIPFALCLSSGGDLYISDSNNIIRKVVKILCPSSHSFSFP